MKSMMLGLVAVVMMAGCATSQSAGFLGGSSAMVGVTSSDGDALAEAGGVQPSQPSVAKASAPSCAR